MTHQRPTALAGISLIVRRELGQYLNTWSGYVIAAALLLLTGLLYNVFAVGDSPRYSADVLEGFLYFASGFAIVTGVFFSMRQFAEERDRGTLPLLATSSLTDGQLVLAKFASAMIALVLWLGLTVYMPLLILMNGKVSGGHIFAGYVGLALFGAVGVSVGLFGSSLVKSQLLAAIVSFVIVILMTLLWMTSRVVDGTLGDFIAYMALHDKHFNTFKQGSISLATVVYYLSVCTFFLVLARNVLEARRWKS